MRANLRTATLAIALTVVGAPVGATIYTLTGPSSIAGITTTMFCTSPASGPPYFCGPIAQEPGTYALSPIWTVDVADSGATTLISTPAYISLFDGTAFASVSILGLDEWGNFIFQGGASVHLNPVRPCGAVLYHDCTWQTGEYSGSFLLAQADPPPVPEPTSWMMALLGLGAVGVALRRRRLAIS